MKKLMLVFLFINSLFMAGQDASFKAKTLLDQVSEKVKSYNNISIDFKYEIINSNTKKKQVTRGAVFIQGDKYVLQLLGLTRLFNGKTLYTISPEDEEVTISSDNSDSPATITPSKMLTFYKEGYNYSIDIVQNVKGRKIQFIKLIPKELNSQITHILLGIDSNTKHIYTLIEVGPDNSKTVLTVNSFKTDQPFSKTLFTFDKNKYSDYYINNLD